MREKETRRVRSRTTASTVQDARTSARKKVKIMKESLCGKNNGALAPVELEGGSWAQNDQKDPLHKMADSNAKRNAQNVRYNACGVTQICRNMEKVSKRSNILSRVARKLILSPLDASKHSLPDTYLKRWKQTILSQLTASRMQENAQKRAKTIGKQLIKKQENIGKVWKLANGSLFRLETCTSAVCVHGKK